MPPTIASATSGESRAGRQVVEEEQRLGALHQDVVDAVVHQVDADGVVPARQEGHLQLGADAVGAGHQNRLTKTAGFELEQPTERADVGQDARGEGRTREARIRRTVSLPASMSTPAAL